MSIDGHCHHGKAEHMKAPSGYAGPAAWLSTLTLLLSGLFAGLLNPAAASAAVQTTLYVSPSGSGTACSSSAPCSLSQAKSTVEGLVGSMTGDIAVFLAGGTYRLSSTFQLGPQDSGQNGHTVSWQAAAGQTPVISGATQVTGWSQYDASRNIWRASVPAGTASRPNIIRRKE